MKKAGFFLAALVVVLGRHVMAGQTYIPYPQASEKSVKPPDDCARYLHDACKNWRIATWLPLVTDDAQKSGSVSFMDGFVYEGTIPKGPDWRDLQGMPRDGTAFTYGTAGPPQGQVVYDYARHIAFYGQGCCSWHSTVLASGVSAPPVTVPNRALANVRTLHGIMLGQSSVEVQTRYGKAASRSASTVPGMRVFTYVHTLDRGCDQQQTFGFLHDRLVYIDLTNAC